MLCILDGTVVEVLVVEIIGSLVHIVVTLVVTMVTVPVLVLALIGGTKQQLFESARYD